MKLHRSRVKRHSMAVALGIMAGLLLLVLGGVAAIAATLNYVPNEYIVTATKGASLTAVTQSVAQLGGAVVRPLPLPDTYLISTAKRKGVLRSLSVRTSPQPYVIKTITPNYVAQAYGATAVPNDPLFDQLWGMGSINMPRAWGVEKGSASVTVGVLDSGVADHPDLEGRIVPGYDFVENDADPSNDLDGHGTHVSGTIAAQGDNGMGVCGVCWDNVNIMPIRVLGPTGFGSFADIISGLDYALNQHVDVVNMSLGGPYGDPNMHLKIQELNDAGIIICAAAGNDGDFIPPDVGYPAAWDECIAVAAIGPNDEISYFSSYGPNKEVDIAAPGGDDLLGMQAMVLSTAVSWEGNVPTFDYMYEEGTSMACPHVAGGAALLLSNGVPANQVRDRLISTARKPKSGTMDTMKYGAGILDMAAALVQGSIGIAKPVKGSTVTDNPDFKISVRGIDPNSLNVYLDYADGDQDDLPDDLSSEIPVLSGRAAIQYLNVANTAFSFNWSSLSSTPLSPGLHFIYVTATTTGGDLLSDWGTFSVSSILFSKGTYLVSLPYEAALSLTDGLRHPLPQELLWDAATSQPLDFRADSPTRSKLLRWSTLDSQYMYYTPGDSGLPAANDRSWNNLISPILDAPTGGGYLSSDLNTLKYPAGTGFWLVLQQDAVVNSNIAPISVPAGFTIPLYKGWNLIGNPYNGQVALSNITIWYHGQTRTLQQDQDPNFTRNPWLQKPAGQSSQFFGYSSVGTPGYVAVPWIGGGLKAYQGYWLRALVGGSQPEDKLLITLRL